MAISIPRRHELLDRWRAGRTSTSTSTSTDARGHARRRRRILRRVVIVAAVAGIGLAGGYALSRTSLVDARSIEVSGSTHLSRSQVLAAGGIGGGTNVVWFDAREAERLLEREPWVASAQVSVSLPWTIRVRVSERVPVALASDGSTTSLVAGDGTVLATDASIRGLPRIVLPPVAASDGARPPIASAAAALAAMPDGLRARVARVVAATDGTLELRLDDGVSVRYGTPTERGRKAHTLARILAWADARGEPVSRVTVVAPRMPTVVFGP